MRLSGAKTVAWKALPSYSVPLAIGIMAAALELGGEPVRLALRYQRDAIAAGEFWRLASGHLVHLGVSHMLMNVAALAVLWFVLSPYLKTPDWVASALASMAAIDAGLYFVDDQVLWYVGLSGMLHGFWASASVMAIGQRRIEGLVLGLLLIGKLLYESMAGSVGLTAAIAGGAVVTEAHAWGALGGFSSALVLRAIRAWRRPL
jgi:rhomboid family GlyGly-CTERM serine protease